MRNGKEGSQVAALLNGVHRIGTHAAWPLLIAQTYKVLGFPEVLEYRVPKRQAGIPKLVGAN
jgi:hypothetical protein